MVVPLWKSVFSTCKEMQQMQVLARTCRKMGVVSSSNHVSVKVVADNTGGREQALCPAARGPRAATSSGDAAERKADATKNATH